MTQYRKHPQAMGCTGVSNRIRAHRVARVHLQARILTRVSRDRGLAPSGTGSRSRQGKAGARHLGVRGSRECRRGMCQERSGSFGFRKIACRRNCLLQWLFGRRERERERAGHRKCVELEDEKKGRPWNKRVTPWTRRVEKISRAPEELSEWKANGTKGKGR